MLRKLPAALTNLTAGAALLAGLLPPAIAAANVSLETDTRVQATTNGTTTASAKARPALTTPVTLEQVRAAMAEAQQRRAALMKPDPTVADAAIRAELLEKWGVAVYGLRRAARGYMIDFRFRVIDADKALPLFDPRTRPYILTERSNIKLPVPKGAKVGAFRTTNRGKNIKADKDYYMMFANPDSHVAPGQQVSVVIGDFRVDKLTLR